jgi:hypothetical protein
MANRIMKSWALFGVLAVLSASALSAIAGGAENDVLGDGYLPIEEV